ncbi:MAG: hypothetical protein MK213_10475 [Planctomycetes bacterium]|nr:hypothetical protein [Planctomycetota bacterium]
MLFALALLVAQPGFIQDSAGDHFDQASLEAKAKEILPRVEQIRGWKFKHAVEVGMNTPEQFIEFAKKEMDEEEALEKMKNSSKMMIQLGLLEPKTDLYKTSLDLLESQVGGYYDPKQKKFFMMTTFNQGAMADIIMAHELTHALDDQYFQLDKMLEKAEEESSDSIFAVRSVVEGSGTSAMNLYTVQGGMKGWLQLDAVAMAESMKASQAGLEDAPVILVASLTLPYLEGNKFLTKSKSMMQAAMAVPNNKDLERAFRTPPTSSEQILHPEKYWDEKQWDAPRDLQVADVSASLGAGWSEAERDTLGELTCFLVCSDEVPDLGSPEGQMASWISDASAGWGGDEFVLYAGPEGAELACWVLAWDTPEDCGEFVHAFGMKHDGVNPSFQGMDEFETSVTLWFSNEKGAPQVAAARKALIATKASWMKSE